MQKRGSPTMGSWALARGGFPASSRKKLLHLLLEQQVWQPGVNDLAVLFEPRLLRHSQGGGVGREDEGDHFLEVQLAGPVEGSNGGLGGEAVAVEVGFDAP